MKIRHDFVTNSSSSSFIVAIKKDVSVDERNKYLENFVSAVTKYKEGKDWWNCDKVEDAGEAMLDLFSDIEEDGLDLGNWMVGSKYVSSDGNLFEGYVYDRGIPKADWIKAVSIY